MPEGSGLGSVNVEVATVRHQSAAHGKTLGDERARQRDLDDPARRRTAARRRRRRGSWPSDGRSGPRGRGDGQARQPRWTARRSYRRATDPFRWHAEQGAGVAVVGEEQAAPGPPRQPDQVVPGQAAEGGPLDRAARLPVDHGRALEEDEGAPRVVGGAADVLRGQVGRRPHPCRPVSAQHLGGVRDDVTPSEYGRRTGAGVDAERAPRRRPGEQRSAVVPTVRRQPRRPASRPRRAGCAARGSTRCPWDARRRVRRSLSLVPGGGG